MVPPIGSNEVGAARSLIDEAACITVLTGAGISTDSGIPDFRGPDGLWTKNPEAERLSTIGVYRSDSEVRRRAWARRIETATWQHEPNAGHDALVTLERAGKLRALITQNVDGLHGAAGTSAELLIEVHGNLREVECIACGDRAPIMAAVERVRAGEQDPDCLDCGGVLKPAVVFFGESLDEGCLAAAFAAAGDCDLFLVLGSSLLVHPVNETVVTAVNGGARLVIVNAQTTPYDRLADVVLRAPISEVLPRLVA